MHHIDSLRNRAGDMNGGRGLSRSRLSDQTQSLALVDVEGDTVHGVQDRLLAAPETGPAHRELDGEALYPKERLRSVKRARRRAYRRF